MVAGRDGVQGDGGAAGAEQGGQPGRMVVRHDGVPRAVGDENAFASEGAGEGRLIEHQHGAEEHGAAEGFRAQLEEGGRNVGAIGEAHRDQTPPVESMVIGRGGDEIRQRMCAPRDFGGIEDPLGEPREEAPGAVFAHIAARAEQGGTRRERAAELEQVAFIAARAV